jgi:hypothetical protein
MFICDVPFVSVDEAWLVANTIAQHGTHRIGKTPPIRYPALRAALQKVAAFALDREASVHMPRIGTDLKWASVIVNHTRPFSLFGNRRALPSAPPGKAGSGPHLLVWGPGPKRIVFENCARRFRAPNMLNASRFVLNPYHQSTRVGWGRADLLRRAQFANTERLGPGPQTSSAFIGSRQPG